MFEFLSIILLFVMKNVVSEVTQNDSKSNKELSDSEDEDSNGLKSSIRNSFVFSKTAFFVFGVLTAILVAIVLCIGCRALVLAFYTNFFREETPPVLIANLPLVPENPNSGEGRQSDQNKDQIIDKNKEKTDESVDKQKKGIKSETNEKNGEKLKTDLKENTKK